MLETKRPRPYPCSTERPPHPTLCLPPRAPLPPGAADWPLRPQVELNFVAGYGSPKDVAVYAALGLPPSQTYIVGRAVRKLQAQCQVRAE